MIKILKFAKICIEENIKLIKRKLVIHNFGNVSIRIDKNHFVIKPSGAHLTKLKPQDMPVINIISGKKVKKSKTSTDTPLQKI